MLTLKNIIVVTYINYNTARISIESFHLMIFNLKETKKIKLILNLVVSLIKLCGFSRSFFKVDILEHPP